MNLFKKVCAVSMAAVMTFSVAPLSAVKDLDFGITASAASNVVASGKCGKNVSYELDANGKLRIFGKGAMYGYEDDEEFSLSNDKRIKSVVVENGVTSIGNSAVTSCENLKSITIADSVKTIEMSAFSSSIALTDLKLSKNLKKIDGFAFDNCAALKDVTIPGSVEDIDGYAFADCTSLEKIVIPKSVKYLGDGVFNRCTKLSTVSLPSDIESIGEGLLDNTAYYKNLKNWTNNALYVGNYLLSASALVMGSFKVKDGTILIADSTFAENEKLTGITLPESIEYIGAGAFQGCSRLASVKIPSKVKTIDWRTFSGCSALSKVTLPAGIVTIEGGAFENCTSLGKIALPSGLKVIGKESFYGCKKLVSFSIPKSVETIEQVAFVDTGFFNNKKNWSGNMLYIGDCLVDAYSERLKGTVEIKNGTRLIADSVLECGEKITAIKLPSTVKFIGDSAFSETSIKSIVIPKGVTEIRYGTFDGCSALTAVTIPTTVKTVRMNAFYDCKSLKNVTIPYSVKTIEQNAFGYLSTMSIMQERMKELLKQGYTMEEVTSILIKEMEAMEADGVITITSTMFGEVAVKGFVITGHPASAAEKYAKANKIKFLSRHTIAKPTLTKATFTKDGKLSGKCSDCGKNTYNVIYKVSGVKVASTAAYTGKAVAPSITVKDSFGTTLKKGTDYTLSYKNNTKLGTASVTITLKGNYSGTKTYNFKIVPATVTNLKATQSTSSIKLTWNKVTGATGYRVYRYDTKTKKWVKLIDTKNTSYTVSKLSAGTSYKFAVKAYTKVGKTVHWSASYPQLITATKPLTPTLKVSSGSFKANLSWNKISGASGYVVYMATSKNGKYSKVANVKGGDKLSYSKSKLLWGKTYYFKVAAYKTVDGKNIYSAFSPVKSVKIK